MASAPDDLPPVSPPPRICRLGDEDAAAVDRLLGDGLGSDAAPGDDRETAISDLLGLLDDYPTEPAPDELVHATLARVARAEQERSSRLSIQNQIGTPRGPIRLPDFFAVAAALLFAVGIGWPLLQTLESNHQVAKSQNRLGAVGQAVAGFAGDSGGWLPFDESVMSPGEDGLFPCGIAGEHSRHLHQLADQERLRHAHLFIGDADGDAKALVSYRVVFQRNDFRIDRYGPAEALAGDPNPVIESLRRRQRAAHHADGATFHEGDGVVILLFDGSTPFLGSAIRMDGDGERDGIWVHDGYDPDLAAEQTLRPADLEDDVLSH